MSHVKKTEAFARLIDFCKGYGGIYNPGRPNLQVDALINQRIEIESAMELVKVAKTNLDNQVNLRKQKFDALSRLISSILRTLEASGAKPEKLKDARMFVHQIIGSSPRSRAPIPSGNEATPWAKRSQLQLAYVSKVDAFSKLVQAARSEARYQPNEKHLGPAGLEEKIVELTQANQHVDEARAYWRKALQERNRALYRSEESMVKNAQAAKKYVRAIFGLNSAQYALVKKIDFSNLKRI